MSESTVKVFFELVKAGLFSHTEITENTETLMVQGSWCMVKGYFNLNANANWRSRRKGRTLMVDFPLRAVELNLHDSGFRVKG